MSKLITMLVGGLLLLSSCERETIRGGGAIGSSNRTVPEFTNVELGGSGEATIQYGTTRQVTVTGYENLLPIYETRVNGNTLYLQFKSDEYNVRNSNIKVSITIPALSSVRINGSGKIEAAGFLNGDVFSAAINGSGNIRVAGSNYDKATYSINGSGEINAAATAVNEAIAQISGSGNIDLRVTGKLKATISGSGEINYWGNPATLETQVSGSGKIIKK